MDASNPNSCTHLIAFPRRSRRSTSTTHPSPIEALSSWRSHATEQGHRLAGKHIHLRFGRCRPVRGGRRSRQRPRCPSDWPEQSADGSGVGQIDYEGFYTDGDGDEWYIIRSADSNGATIVRAYDADDGYDAGYRSGSPAETRYLIVRRAGETEDATGADRLSFQKESEEPSGASSRPPSPGAARRAATLTPSPFWPPRWRS